MVTGGFNVTGSLESELLLARLNGTGTVDAGFGLGGFGRIDGGATDAAASVFVQPDAKVVVGGASTFGAGFVMRSEVDGTADPTFGDDGTGVVATRFEVRGVARGPASTIVAAGEGFVEIGGEQSRRAGFVQRFLSDGTPDPSFNDGEPKIIDLGDDDRPGQDSTTINGVTVLDDGRIAVVGSRIAASTDVDGQLAIVQSLFAARLVEDGALDDDFGTGCIQRVAESSHAEGRALARTADGGLVLTGSVQGISSGSPAPQLVVVRLTEDGDRDPPFAVGADKGFGPGVLYDPIGGTSTGAGIAVRADGRIVVAGTTGTGCDDEGCPSDPEAFVTQYSADGRRDGGFDGDGPFTGRAAGGNAVATGVTIDATGTLLVSGAVTNTSSDVMLLAVSATGALKPDFGDGGVVATDLGFGERGAAVALAPGRKILVGGAIADDRGERLLVARYDPLAVPPPPPPPPPPDEPPQVFTPTVTFNPAVGRGGTVTSAVFTGFPPGTTVTVVWSQGIQLADPTIAVGADGSLVLPVLILPSDAIGPRTMTATTTHPDTGELIIATGAYLVATGTAQPGDFVGRR